MNEAIMEKKEGTVWETKQTVGDESKRIGVEKVSNGYIISIEKSGYKKKGDEKEWYSETTKLISSEDPREMLKGKKEEKKDDDWAVKQAIMTWNNGLEVGII